MATASSPLSSISGALDALSALSPLGGLGSDTTAPSTPTNTSGPSWLSGTVAQFAVIILGLLLIAAGIFSFDKAREVIVTGSRAAAAVAA